LSIGNIVGISALMHMDNTLKGTNVEFNKNTKQKIIKINSGYFWVPRICSSIVPVISLKVIKGVGLKSFVPFCHAKS
jgi:hypothetical protein